MHTNKKGPNSKYSLKFYKSSTVFTSQVSLLNKKQWNGVLFSDKHLRIVLMPQKETTLIYFPQLWVQLNGKFEGKALPHGGILTFSWWLVLLLGACCCKIFPFMTIKPVIICRIKKIWKKLCPYMIVHTSKQSIDWQNDFAQRFCHGYINSIFS